MDISDCTPKRLTPEYTILPFDSGEEDITAFLLDDAKDYLSQLMAVTYLFECNGITAAYFCVSNDLVTYNEALQSKSQWKRLLKKSIPHPKRHHNSLPAVKIGRLGVHESFHKCGLGTQILDNIKYSFVFRNKTGCRFLLVDAINKPVVTSFYQKNDFEYLGEKDSAEKTRLMIFDLKRFADAIN